eukprot:11393142-Ditylum_brightwellii.AAC.1
MEEYLETYGTNTEDDMYSIQIKTGNPNITIMGQCVESEVMSIYARKSHAKLSIDLMEFIAPTSNKSVKNNIKFILAHMQFDKLLPNAAQKYADLLREKTCTWKSMTIAKLEVFIVLHWTMN